MDINELIKLMEENTGINFETCTNQDLDEIELGEQQVLAPFMTNKENNYHFKNTSIEYKFNPKLLKSIIEKKKRKIFLNLIFFLYQKIV